MSQAIEDDKPTLFDQPDARITTDQDLTRELDTKGAFDLLPAETWWSEQYEFLLSRGYELRRRFRPGWKPSWADTNLNPFYCEDAYNHRPEYVMDAKRISNGEVVALKRVRSTSDEATFSRMLSTPEGLRDTRNHCVPILDRIEGDEQKSISFLVMPLLRKFNDPPFYFVEEIVDFVRQTLEALVHIHDAGVRKCDLSNGNIMMDKSSLYPEGFHPDRSTKDIVRDAPDKSRDEAGPATYYVIDFGLSWYYSDPSQPRLANAPLSQESQDQDVSELEDSNPYDPCPADVCTLGHVYKRNFLDIYANVNFLRPLVDRMMQHNPSTASEALNEFELHASNLPKLELHGRLHKRDESWLPMVLRDTKATARETQRRSWAIIREAKKTNSKEVSPRTAATTLYFAQLYGEGANRSM